MERKRRLITVWHLKLQRRLDIAEVGAVVGIDLIHDAVTEDVGKKDVDVNVFVQIVAKAGFDNLTP